MNCVQCRRPSDDPVYIGRLRCCDRRVMVCRGCRPAILEVFETVGAFAKKYGMLHATGCSGPPERMVH